MSKILEPTETCRFCGHTKTFVCKSVAQMAKNADYGQPHCKRAFHKTRLSDEDYTLPPQQYVPAPIFTPETPTTRDETPSANSIDAGGSTDFSGGGSSGSWD